MHHSFFKNQQLLLLVLLISIQCAAQDEDARLTEIWSPVPRLVTPGNAPAAAPSDAIVLLGNSNDSAHWLGENEKPFGWSMDAAIMTVVPGAGSIHTRQSFGDCQLHIEWRTPAIVKDSGQGRGNSGIYLMGRYELQVLDSYQNPTYSNGQAGSIYKQHMPLVNVCRPPGEWQTYDIIFTAPVFYADGALKSAARITVFQNNVLIQNNVELWGATTYIGVAAYQKHNAKEPLLLQDHGNAVSYRNIWIREL